ncbi:hypothetical protein NC653_019939 [Populus alba x Populus x berolinensis]|uniref:Uncharacterized protein n=1 Tax=Populus alba x Populus x berolinensis TaxID=444605 RepID=A0AAD6QBV8_9ROSI|nr:hypothetical protein NC653_019939 [Populus alba x Populus x berolinensis]
MEEGHHDLSKVTVAGDPQLLQNKVNTVRLAGPAKLQSFFSLSCNLFSGSFIHGILRQGNADYDNKRQALYEYYQILQEDLLLDDAPMWAVVKLVSQMCSTVNRRGLLSTSTNSLAHPWL